MSTQCPTCGGAGTVITDCPYCRDCDSYEHSDLAGKTCVACGDRGYQETGCPACSDQGLA